MRRAQAWRHGRQEGFSGGVYLTVVMFLLAAAGTAWVYWGMVNSERWPIRWLQVDGPFHRVSAEQLRAGVARTVTGSFFTIDLENVRETARRIPWVESVKVTKQWPDTVHVRVEEYEPVAHWNEGQLLSTGGEVFAVPGADEMQGMPWLAGPDTELERVRERWRRFDETLLALNLEVARLTLDRRGAWSVTLSNGTHLDLGRDHELARLERLVASWPALTEGREVLPLGVDLRYTNGFAVRWPQVGEDRTES